MDAAAVKQIGVGKRWLIICSGCTAVRQPIEAPEELHETAARGNSGAVPH